MRDDSHIWIFAAILFFLTFIIKKRLDVTEAQYVQSLLDRYSFFVAESSYRFQVPPSLLYAIMTVESRGDPQAIGSAGERGLMQMMRSALADANRYAGTNFSFDELYNPRVSILTGAAYLAWLRDRFGGDYERAIRAYNVGIGRIQQNPTLGTTYFNNVTKWQKIFRQVV